MSANFNLSIISQSMMFFEDLKVSVSEKLINFSKQHTNIARFTGLPIALCSSLLDLAQTVSTIGESLIKGVANIFGSPFSEKCKFSKGVKQIFVQFPAHIFNGVVGWPLGTAFEVLVTPFRMLISPISASESRKEKAEQTKQVLDVISNDRDFRLPQADPIYTAVIKANMLLMKHIYT